MVWRPLLGGMITLRVQVNWVWCNKFKMLLRTTAGRCIYLSCMCYCFVSYLLRQRVLQSMSAVRQNGLAIICLEVVHRISHIWMSQVDHPIIVQFSSICRTRPHDRFSHYYYMEHPLIADTELYDESDFVLGVFFVCTQRNISAASIPSISR